VLVELIVGIAVLAAAGVLATAVPARGPEFAPTANPKTPLPGWLSVRADDLLVTLTAKPNRVGTNVFQAIVGSAQRPPPGEVLGVTLRFRRGAETAVAPMTEVGPGRYRVSGDYLNQAGRWEVDVDVDRTRSADAVAPFDWRTAPAAGRAVVVSNRPFGPLLTALSIILLVGVLAASAILLRGPPRRPDPPQEPGALRSV
jgi:copper transport protein